MDKEKFFKVYFRIMGIYDVVLGGAFLLFFRNIYQALNIVLPNHPGYIYVPALFLVSGGIGEFFIANNPLGNIDLVKVRMLMKLSFAAAVFYCYFKYGVPNIFMLISILSIFGVIKSVLFIRWARSVK